jgi:hypothetical protein
MAEQNVNAPQLKNTTLIMQNLNAPQLKNTTLIIYLK